MWQRGGIAGFNEGNGLNDRLTRAGEGLAGGLIGGGGKGRCLSLSFKHQG
jgi:hypothetical protein